jgi:hypothetical protein
MADGKKRGGGSGAGGHRPDCAAASQPAPGSAGRIRVGSPVQASRWE